MRKLLSEHENHELYEFIDINGQPDTFKLWVNRNSLKTGKEVIWKEELVSSQGITVTVKTKLSTIERKEFKRIIQKERDIVYFSFLQGENKYNQWA